MNTPQEIIRICNSHYNYWKKRALNSDDPVERVKAMEKAFFWLETQSSMLIVWAIENSNGNNEKMLRNIVKAKVNISKKLMDYAEQILREFE